MKKSLLLAVLLTPFVLAPAYAADAPPGISITGVTPNSIKSNPTNPAAVPSAPVLPEVVPPTFAPPDAQAPTGIPVTGTLEPQPADPFANLIESEEGLPHPMDMPADGAPATSGVPDIKAPLLPKPVAAPINAEFINVRGEVIGTAVLKQVGEGTMITVDLELPEGAHAIHVHEHDQCDAPDFKTAGGHFNPDGHVHGFANPAGYHAGDLPNLYVEPTGYIKTEIFSPSIQLSGEKSIGHGTALVIHEKADDYTSEPSGNSGARIACAVIHAAPVPGAPQQTVPEPTSPY